jgi:hypothetical protein
MVRDSCFPVSLTLEAQPHVYQLNYFSLHISTPANAAQAGGRIYLDGYRINV